MKLSRRSLLGSGAAIGVGALAGCLSAPDPQTVRSLPAPAMGASDAPVTIHSFEDFTCKFCEQFALEIRPRVEQNYVEQGTVRFVRHDYPFLDPEWSWKAANAARAVQDTRGDEAFFQFADGLYRNRDSFSLSLFRELAEEVGAAPAAVERAVETERYRPVLEADRDRGDELAVTKTPTVFVNGARPDSPRYQHLVPAIESHL
jgi:protein-disulfide isomerase